MCDKVLCAQVKSSDCPYGLGKNGCCLVCARGPGETCLTYDKVCGTGMFCNTARPSSIWSRAGVCVYFDASRRR
ncbi:hypothetical protein MRX96_028740 [Rhipicephalus microplus]